MAAMWRETQNEQPIFPDRVDCLQRDVTFVIVHLNDCWVVLGNIHMLNEMLQHNDKQFTVHPPGRCGKAKASVRGTFSMWSLKWTRGNM